MIKRKFLKDFYEKQKLSMAEIAKKLDVGTSTVQNWMARYKIKSRSRSDALYVLNNPFGDPFKFKKNFTKDEIFLFGLGIGFFWGEGMKLQKDGVRLGNSDPYLVLRFRDFLENICGVSREKLKYSLQLFGDVDKEKAIMFWCDILLIKPEKLGKVSIVKLRGKGTYGKKNEFGVLQIACHNSKLKLVIDRLIENLKTRHNAVVAQMVEQLHG